MTPEQNKALVQRMNKEFIEGKNESTVFELVADDFINHTAPPGSPAGPQAVIYFFNTVLWPSFPDLKVEILDQIAEGNKVTTRKRFHATHSGEFFGVPATGRQVTMNVIDIIELRDGKFIGHWGILDTQHLMMQITAEAVEA